MLTTVIHKHIETDQIVAIGEFADMHKNMLDRRRRFTRLNVMQWYSWGRTRKHLVTSRFVVQSNFFRRFLNEHKWPIVLMKSEVFSRAVAATDRKYR